MAKRELDLSGLDDLNLGIDVEVAATSGKPLLVPYQEVYEDPENPRTEYPEADLEGMTASVIQNGILQPIVVWPKDARGYKIQFGAKRRRAAERAAAVTGVHDVPIIINASASSADIGYAQVAENKDRHELSPMDMALFIRKRVEAGDKQVFIADRLGIDPARVVNFLSLLDLPEVLKEVYENDRSRSPQVLKTLLSLYRRYSVEVTDWLSEGEEITKASVAKLEQRFIAARGAKEGAALGGDVSAGSPVASVGNHDSAQVSNVMGSVGAAKGEDVASSKLAPKRDADIALLERRMTETLGSRSTIQYSPSTRAGTIRIRFTSLDVLEGLLKRFKIPGEFDPG